MILIIGATGFIGMYTAEAFLKNGYQVLATGRNEKIGEALSNEGASFERLDITKEEDFESCPKMVFPVLSSLQDSSRQIRLRIFSVKTMPRIISK